MKFSVIVILCDGGLLSFCSWSCQSPSMILCDPGQNPVCDPGHDPFVVRTMNCDVKAINLFFCDLVWFLCSGVIMVQFVVKNIILDNS